MDLFISLLIFGVHFIGFLGALHATIHGRTPQGTIAWIIFLILIPYVALPIYLIFGQRYFEGYISARRAGDFGINHLARKVYDALKPFEATNNFWTPLNHLICQPATHSNRLNLLINGQATFERIFKAIDEANTYVLLQFYIVRDDDLGKQLARHLINAANRGINIYFIYDEIGSKSLKKSYIQKLKAAGIRMHPFNSNRRNRYQLNFRNHRKVVIIDGILGFIGGHNVGNEYLGIDKKMPHWRDTHLMIEGPSILTLQLSFLEDWFWITQHIPNFSWTPKAASSTAAQNPLTECITLSSGPSDLFETCGLSFLHLISNAQNKLWIVSPYFVPDQSLAQALELAALRGVDVKILIPKKSDNPVVDLAAWTFVQDLSRSGIRFFHYVEGMLHQKVLLVDQRAGYIGTANFDNRSLRINFEVGMVFSDEILANELNNVLSQDLAVSEELQPIDLRKTSIFWGIARLARLISPLL